MATYEKTQRMKRQSVAQLLRRLRQIQTQEKSEIEIPPRANRDVPDLGS